ncbi:MAG: VWA domain-containing protein [Ignavibacteria bacterium]|jgi:hypothetical protein
MKKLIISLLTSGMIVSFIIINGCEEDDYPVSSAQTEEMRLNTNGTIVPVNHTQASGNMFITNQNGKPISGITASNVTAELRWGTDNPLDSGTTGVVSVSHNALSGSNVACALTMDYSGSMLIPQINCMKIGINNYINSMRYDDITEIIKFATVVSVVQPFTNNKDSLKAAINNYTLNIGTYTALYASIQQGINDVKLKSPNFIRSVVAFSDGVDNNSAPVTREQMISNALNTGVPVYTIFLYNDTLGTPYRDMKNIADTTGGFNFWVQPDSCSNVTQFYNKIRILLVSSYNITIDWQGILPPTGTIARATITTTYNGLTSSFTRSYIIP